MPAPPTTSGIAQTGYCSDEDARAIHQTNPMVGRIDNVQTFLSIRQTTMGTLHQALRLGPPPHQTFSLPAVCIRRCIDLSRFNPPVANVPRQRTPLRREGPGRVLPLIRQRPANARCSFRFRVRPSSGALAPTAIQPLSYHCSHG